MLGVAMGVWPVRLEWFRDVWGFTKAYSNYKAALAADLFELISIPIPPCSPTPFPYRAFP